MTSREPTKARAVAKDTMLRRLAEHGLRLVRRTDRAEDPFRLPDASVGGRGFQAPYRDADWSRIRASIYEGRGG